MDATSVLNIILPIVFIIVGIVLIWFLIELSRTVKTTRKAVDDLQNKVTPTLEHVDQITSDLQPAITKVDPMMERLALTVDAVNLELMRVDQILEDVNDVTGSLSKTSNAIDTVTSAPFNLVSNMTERVRGALKSSKQPSEESIALAEAASDRDVLADQSVLNELEQTAEIPIIDDEMLAAVNGEHAASSGYFTYAQDGTQNTSAPIDENPTPTYESVFASIDVSDGGTMVDDPIGKHAMMVDESDVEAELPTSTIASSSLDAQVAEALDLTTDAEDAGAED